MEGRYMAMLVIDSHTHMFPAVVRKDPSDDIPNA